MSILMFLKPEDIVQDRIYLYYTGMEISKLSIGEQGQKRDLLQINYLDKDGEKLCGNQSSHKYYIIRLDL